MIRGGYYIKARKIQESEIAHAPPHVREIWDWLIKEANHEDKKVGNKIVKRGQCIRSYKDMQEGLKWYAGWRKMTYSKGDCETSMKHLKKHAMITTTRTTRGILITIVNYGVYQNPASYETYTKPTKQANGSMHPNYTINKNNKKEEERRESTFLVKDYVKPETNSDLDVRCNAAKWMYDELLSLNPSSTQLPKAKLNTWSDDIRLLMEQDGKKLKEIAAVFKWAMGDEFWKVTVRAPSGLRKNWDAITLQMGAKDAVNAPIHYAKSDRE